MRFTRVDVDGERDATLVILGDLTHRRRAEEALRHSQAKYVSLFEHMATGFVLMRVVLDRRNLPVDYSVIEVNPAVERLFGLKASQLVGRPASEAIALVGGVDLDWRAVLAPVAITGESNDAEVFVPSVHRWISMSVFSPTRGHVALMLSDVTSTRRSPAAAKDVGGT